VLSGKPVGISYLISFKQFQLINFYVLHFWYNHCLRHTCLKKLITMMNSKSLEEICKGWEVEPIQTMVQTDRYMKITFL